MLIPIDILETLGADFQKFVTELSLNQVEYDLASERTFREHARVAEDKFGVGEREYDLVVLHRTCKNLTDISVKFLEQYLSSGGRILCVGGKPSLVNGRESAELEKMFNLQ